MPLIPTQHLITVMVEGAPMAALEAELQSLPPVRVVSMSVMSDRGYDCVFAVVEEV